MSTRKYGNNKVNNVIKTNAQTVKATSVTVVICTIPHERPSAESRDFASESACVPESVGRQTGCNPISFHGGHDPDSAHLGRETYR